MAQLLPPDPSRNEQGLVCPRSDTVHWLVYQPAYRVRWLEDSEVTLWESTYEMFSGRELHNVRKAARELHNVRKAAADDVVKKGATSYLNRVESIAKTAAVTYKGIEKPQDFWDYIKSFPANSINRVWYCGHAAHAGLFLQLAHTSGCAAVAATGSLVATSQIGDNTSLKDRFVKGTKSSSRFYGCNTLDFARAWHDTFGVPSEGAGSSITFAGVFGSAEGVLSRLETTYVHGKNPLWTKFE